MSAALTVLSYGGGQDSDAILKKIMYDPEFASKYVKGKLIVIMAETGNEHPETYEHVKKVQEECKVMGIEFYHLNYYYTGEGWKGGLIEFYKRGNRIGSKAFPKTCTDKLKIQPVYKFLEDYVYLHYNEIGVVGRKRAIKKFNKLYGRINVLIGIAKGEEKRASTNAESLSVWMRECINKVYPLIEEGMGRQECQDYITSKGHEVPRPSACILCPFMNDIELLALYRFKPEWYAKWVELEANKIAANQHVENNLGVWGNKLLPEKLVQVTEKYGHMTDEDLREYTMSHGHCVKSKY